METSAISINDVVKSYWQHCMKGEPKNVLQDVNFTVKRATICGLLGPSGCGKTTLLNCITGQACVDRGKILIFGLPTGTKECGIPGSRVGYMPQDIALSQELKIGETLNFYGCLMGLTASEIKANIQMYTELLELPPPDRFIGTLSLGQQRRVSLAASLIHSPELIILDEPTVGVDPILRKRIWDHLVELTNANHQTILITTHYIEEATMAHTVGMMYDGMVVCEGTPDNIIQQHHSTTLEGAFLAICLDLGNKHMQAEKLSNPNMANSARLKHTVCAETVPIKSMTNLKNSGRPTRNIVDGAWRDRLKMLFRPVEFRRVKALTICNLRKSYRHIGNLLIHLLTPCMIIIAFQVTFGRFPQRISMGVYNEDSEELSAIFLSSVDNDNVILRDYSSYEEGYQAVQNGDTWGIIHVPSNFTQTLVSRFLHENVEANSSFQESSITLAMDLTCHPITITVYDSLVAAFVKFGQVFFKGIGLEPAVVTPPIRFHYDIFEQDWNGLMGFAIPGIILCGLYFLAMGSCILSLLSDKANGQFLRSTVSGITEIELLLSNILAFTVGVVTQVISFICVTFWILGIDCKGSLPLAFALILLHGICGTAYGLFISVFCSSEFTAIMFGFGSFLPTVCLSGSVWPIKSIPIYLQSICRVLPHVFTVEALTAIMKRGWGLSHPEVLYGLSINVFWIAIFLMFSAILLRLKQD